MSDTQEVAVTPEMFVELEEHLKQEIEDGYRVISDEYEQKSKCPIRKVIMTNGMLFILLEQMIYAEMGLRERVNYFVLNCLHVQKMHQELKADA